MDNFVAWYDEDKFTADHLLFDIGMTTREAICRYKNGFGNAEDCGLADEYSNGNGSLMRMLPFVYFIYLHEWEKSSKQFNDRVRTIIDQASALTHAHHLSQMSCCYYLCLGLTILDYRERWSLTKIIEKAIADMEAYYQERKETIEIYSYLQRENLWLSMELDQEQLQSSGFVIHSLEASFWCLYHSRSYEEAVLTAVNLGKDTDTIGAITGSLAALYYGLENIPKVWIAELRNKELIDEIGIDFYRRYH